MVFLKYSKKGKRLKFDSSKINRKIIYYLNKLNYHITESLKTNEN